MRAPECQQAHNLLFYGRRSKTNVKQDRQWLYCTSDGSIQVQSELDSLPVGAATVNPGDKRGHNGKTHAVEKKCDCD